MVVLVHVGSHRGRRYYRNRGLYRAVVARFTESGPSTRRDYCAASAEPALGENFGEIEFWFAMIKIVAICALIIVGAIMVVYELHDTQRCSRSG